MGQKLPEQWDCCWCQHGPYNSQNYVCCIICGHVACENCYYLNGKLPSKRCSREKSHSQPDETLSSIPPGRINHSNRRDHLQFHRRRIKTGALPVEPQPASTRGPQPRVASVRHRPSACLGRSKTARPCHRSEYLKPPPPHFKPPRVVPMSENDPNAAGLVELAQPQEKRRPYKDRLKDPSSFTNQWVRLIVPTLAASLKSLVGNDFSIQIVRDRSEETRAKAVLHLEKEDKKTRSFVREHLGNSFHFIWIVTPELISQPEEQESIKDAFRRNLHPKASYSMFKFRFFQGEVVRAARDISTTGTSQTPEPYEMELCMGCSIGQGLRSSGTLCQFISIDKVPFALTVQHLLEDLNTESMGQSSSSEDSRTSDADHNELYAEKAMREENGGNIGRVLCTSNTSQVQNVTATDGFCSAATIDWALLSLEGRGTHGLRNYFRRPQRYPEPDDSNASQEEFAMQDEVTVTSMVEVAGGERIELIGRTSGHRYGVVADEPMFISRDEGHGRFTEVFEWNIQPIQVASATGSTERDSSQEQWAALVRGGDSGAPVVTLDEHKSLGMVWGYTLLQGGIPSGGCFTPMVSIINDIKQVVNSKIGGAPPVEIHKEGETASESAVTGMYARFTHFELPNHDSNITFNVFYRTEGGSHVATAGASPQRELSEDRELEPNDHKAQDRLFAHTYPHDDPLFESYSPELFELGGKESSVGSSSSAAKRPYRANACEGSLIRLADQNSSLRSLSTSESFTEIHATIEEGPSQKRRKTEPCDNCTALLQSLASVYSDLKQVEDAYERLNRAEHPEVHELKLAIEPSCVEAELQRLSSECSAHELLLPIRTLHQKWNKLQERLNLRGHVGEVQSRSTATIVRRARGS